MRGGVLNGEAITAPNARGERVVDGVSVVFQRNSSRPVDRHPDGDYAEEWTAVLDTWQPSGDTDLLIPAKSPPRPLQFGDRDQGTLWPTRALHLSVATARITRAARGILLRRRGEVARLSERAEVEAICTHPHLTASPSSGPRLDVTDVLTVSGELGSAGSLASCPGRPKPAVVRQCPTTSAWGHRRTTRGGWDVLRHGRDSGVRLV